MNKTLTGENMKNITILFVIVDGFITWLFWWGIAIGNQFGHLLYGTPLMMVLFLIGGNSESIMAVVLLLITKQMTGKQLLKTICSVNQPPRFYFLVFVTLFISYCIPVVMGSAAFIAPFYMAILSLPIMVIGGGLEEIWWRFIVQPYFERKMNFTFATLITGSMWAIWHLPNHLYAPLCYPVEYLTEYSAVFESPVCCPSNQNRRTVGRLCLMLFLLQTFSRIVFHKDSR